MPYPRNQKWPGKRHPGARPRSASQQGDIAVEGRDVFYSVYDGSLPSGEPFSMVYLVNHDIYGQSAYPNLLVRGKPIPMRVPGRDLRVVWIIGTS